MAGHKTGTCEEWLASGRDANLRRRRKAITMQVIYSGACELEVQRRDMCARYASRAQQIMIAGAGSTGGILVVCIGRFKKFFRSNRLGPLQETQEN
jgi:hypothetical protein